MASFPSSATTGGARKHIWTKISAHKKISFLVIPQVCEMQKMEKKEEERRRAMLCYA